MGEAIDWLNFYNAKRLRSTLDYANSMQFEKIGSPCRPIALSDQYMTHLLQG
jgi:hypothetical protein